MTESRPVVQIAQGELRGIIEESIFGKKYASFKGIPYAKPPVGELRFRDPEPAEPWSSTLDASEFGSNCAQIDLMSKTYIGGDDCLYLNVYAPLDFQSNDLPPRSVMVWIHGGAFTHGSGDDTIYGPDYIVVKNVVLVTINYRVGVFGFLNLEDEVATGNQGLKDQVLALKWVQENIGHFGGDPTNVTIFGNSAGSASVHFLTLSPMADGLYHKAIAQSGVACNPWAHSAGNPQKYAQHLAAALGKEIDDPKALVEFLRTVDPVKLNEAYTELSAKLVYPGLFHFVPAADPKSKNPLIPKPIKNAIRSAAKVPFLIGYMSHEGILFLSDLNDEKLKTYDSRIEEALSPGVVNLLRDKGINAADLRKMYFGDKPISEDTIVNYMQMQSDLQFVCGIHDFVEIQASSRQCPTYFYKFSYDNGMSLIKTLFGMTMPGACHADELPYIFYPKIQKILGIPPAAPGSTARLVIDRVTQMWTDFAKTGNPTPAVSDLVPVIWKPVTNAENFECLEITEDLKMGTVKNVNKNYDEKSKSKL